MSGLHSRLWCRALGAAVFLGALFVWSRPLAAIAAQQRPVASGATAKSAPAKPSRQQAKKALEALKTKITQARLTLLANKKRYGAAARKLQWVEQRVAKSVADMRHLQSQLADTNERLQTLKQRQNALNGEKRQQQGLLEQQIRAAYGNGDREYLKLLLNQDDPAEFARMMTYFGYINDARKTQIKALTETLQALARVATDIDQQRRKLVRLTRRQLAEMRRLKTRQAQRKKVVNAWQHRVSSADRRLASMLDDEKGLQAIINAVRKAIEVFLPEESLLGLGGLKGKLRWPVKGRLVSRFGSKRYGGRLRWQGVVLRSREGSAVHAIAAGRVVFSDWLRGYGLLSIIDHGHGYLTLYGHNQTLLKHVGDWIEAGEVLALVGSTGGQGRAGLYFEVRHNNKPVNPAIWSH